jgi:exosortase A-associated hydrolase 2
LSYRSGFLKNRRGTQLFFVDERPDSSDAPAEIWIICSPILEEKNVAHGAFVTLGRALAAKGARAVRIDFEGHGDSDGDTAALGIGEWTDDVADAVEHLAAGETGPITFMGCRAGALIAAGAAARRPAARMVAWCPVLRGEDHLQELLRLNLTTQMAVYKKVVQDREALAAALSSGATVNVIGWTVGQRLVESLSTMSLASVLAPLSCPVELLDLTRKAGDPAPAGVAALTSARVRARGVPGLPFWIDGNYIDYRQAGLVEATVALVGASQ